ncbi:MAG TPA: hypothetical protein VL132_09385, partial [Planctomycetaceae bacterium]|nr:hypothetical protein [Planctomycetaceae bacterium]
MPQPLPVVYLKPGRFAASGYIQRFRRRFMPNSAGSHGWSVKLATVGGTSAEVYGVDDYVRTDLRNCFLVKKKTQCWLRSSRKAL